MSEQDKEEQDVKNENVSTESSTEETEETEGESEATLVVGDEPETEEEEAAQVTPLQARVNELAEDNRRQRALVEQLMQAGLMRQTGQPQQTEEPIDSDMDPAVARGFKQLTQQFQQVAGSLVEENDKTAILISPMAELYKKHQQEVEDYRRQQMGGGVYLKREQALANLMLQKGYFTKTEEKPKKKVVKQKIKPGGETQKAVPVKAKEEKPKSLRDKLINVKF